MWVLWLKRLEVVLDGMKRAEGDWIEGSEDDWSEGQEEQWVNLTD